MFLQLTFLDCTISVKYYHVYRQMDNQGYPVATDCIIYVNTPTGEEINSFKATSAPYYTENFSRQKGRIISFYKCLDSIPDVYYTSKFNELLAKFHEVEKYEFDLFVV